MRSCHGARQFPPKFKPRGSRVFHECLNCLLPVISSVSCVFGCKIVSREAVVQLCSPHRITMQRLLFQTGLPPFPLCPVVALPFRAHFRQTATLWPCNASIFFVLQHCRGVNSMWNRILYGRRTLLSTVRPFHVKILVITLHYDRWSRPSLVHLQIPLAVETSTVRTCSSR